MKRTTSLVYVGLLSLIIGCPGRTEEPTNLGTMVHEMALSRHDAAWAPKIAAATEALKKSNESVLKDELVFLSVVSNREDRMQWLPAIMAALEDKYKDDPASSARLYSREASIYVNVFSDQPKAVELFQKAEALSQTAEIDFALFQLDTYLNTAEAYLGGGMPDKRVENVAQALVYYGKVLKFPLFDEPYYSRINEFKQRYSIAALRTVGLTEMRNIKTLRFYPFVFGRIDQHYPQQAKLLNPNMPGVTENMDRMALWMELTAKEQPADSPLRANLEAILEYLRKKSNESVK